MSSTNKDLIQDLALNLPILNVVHTLLHQNVKIKLMETAGLILVSIVQFLPHAQSAIAIDCGKTMLVLEDMQIYGLEVLAKFANSRNEAIVAAVAYGDTITKLLALLPVPKLA